MIFRFLLALMALGAATAAQAGSCDASNTYSMTFANQPAATLAYGSSYSYTASTPGGASSNVGVQIAQNGLTTTTVAGTQLPALNTMVTGSDATKRDLVIGGIFGSRTTTINSATRVITVTFTFATPIRDLALTVHDVDYTLNQYRDWIYISGANGANTYTGSLALGPTATSAVLGPASTPVAIGAGAAVGSGASANNAEDGTIIASFAQPVTSVTLKYGNYPLQTGELTTGQQAMGIAGIAYCPMPVISMTKTSAPATGTYGAFNVPGNDVIYTLTVTNSGGSTVDAGTIVLGDVMPAGVTFKNTAFDGTTTLPVKLVGAGGVTLASVNIAYRQSGGSTFTYIPASGYDSQVAEIRVTPGGQMAANSSFSIQFKASIK